MLVNDSITAFLPCQPQNGTKSFCVFSAKVDWDNDTQTVIVTTNENNGKTLIFDDLSEFKNNVDYKLGGNLKEAGVSLSTEQDHTTGSGKSLKIDGLCAKNASIVVAYYKNNNLCDINTIPIEFATKGTVSKTSKIFTDASYNGENISLKAFVLDLANNVLPLDISVNFQ